MNGLAFLVFIFWGGLVGLVLYFNRFGKPTYYTLLEYQSGVLFRRGLPLRDIGPGKHKIWKGTEFLVFIDKRPKPISFEQLAVGLKDGGVATYGFFATVEVSDARKAIYCARNYNHAPIAVLLRITRHMLNECDATLLSAGTDAILQRVTASAQAKMRDLGFNLVSLRFSHFSLVDQRTAVAGFAHAATTAK
jgi:hypothetical protein